MFEDGIISDRAYQHFKDKNEYFLIRFSLIMAPAASAMVFDRSQFDQILQAYADDPGVER